MLARPSKRAFCNKSQLSIYILLGVFGKPVFLHVFCWGLADRGSRISIWIMVEPRVESPEQNWSYPGNPPQKYGVLLPGPLIQGNQWLICGRLWFILILWSAGSACHRFFFSFCMLIVVWCSKLVARQCLNFSKRDSRHINHVVFIRFISDVVWHHFGGDQRGGTIHIAADKSHTHLPSSSTECKCQNSFFAVNLF